LAANVWSELATGVFGPADGVASAAPAHAAMAAAAATRRRCRPLMLGMRLDLFDVARWRRAPPWWTAPTTQVNPGL
jgi:hypothetical protein